MHPAMEDVTVEGILHALLELHVWLSQCCYEAGSLISAQRDVLCSPRRVVPRIKPASLAL